MKRTLVEKAIIYWQTTNPLQKLKDLEFENVLAAGASWDELTVAEQARVVVFVNNE